MVGSGSQATWRLTGRDLAARHFRVQTQSDGARVVPASVQNIVVLNDSSATVALVGVAGTVAGVGCCALYTVGSPRWVAGSDSTLRVVFALAFC